MPEASRIFFLIRRVVLDGQPGQGPEFVGKAPPRSTEVGKKEVCVGHLSPQRTGQGKRSLQHMSKPTGEQLYIMSCLPTKGGGPGDWAAAGPGGGWLGRGFPPLYLFYFPPFIVVYLVDSFDLKT